MAKKAASKPAAKAVTAGPPAAQPALPPLDVRQRFTIPETAAYLRISRAYLYTLIKKGEIDVITDGSRKYVPGSVIAERSALPPRVA